MAQYFWPCSVICTTFLKLVWLFSSFFFCLPPGTVSCTRWNLQQLPAPHGRRAATSVAHFSPYIRVCKSVRLNPSPPSMPPSCFQRWTDGQGREPLREELFIRLAYSSACPPYFNIISQSRPRFRFICTDVGSLKLANFNLLTMTWSAFLSGTERSDNWGPLPKIMFSVAH